VPNKKKFLLTQFCNNDEGSSAPDFLIKAPGYDGNTLPDVGDGAKDSGSEFVPGILYPPGSKVVVQNSSDAEHSVLINGCLVKKSFHFKKFKYLTWPPSASCNFGCQGSCPDSRGSCWMTLWREPGIST